MTPRRPAGDVIRYKRSRFATRLPAHYRYTRAHYWLHRERDDGPWQVGLTTFATRMLGDLVECNLTVAAADPVAVGQRIGTIEGFKAMSDLYAVAGGRFTGANGALAMDITLVESAPYGDGWLYAVDGDPDPNSLDVEGYISVLDATIDRMLAGRGTGDPDA